MAQKADAWREYREAAMVEMLLDTLPKVRCDFKTLLTRFLKYFSVLLAGGRRGSCASVAGQKDYHGF